MGGSERIAMHRAIRSVTAASGVWLLASIGLLLPSGVSAQAPSSISFRSIADAQRSLTIDSDQIRRVFDGGSQGTAGQWVAIEERLRIKPFANDVHFRLDFEGVQGRELTSAEKQDRSAIYWSYAGYLFEHGGFRIADPVAAEQNYLLVYLDSGSHLNRTTRRFAVLPRVFGRNAWLVDVDAATSYPLYTAEFNAAGQLVSALEVTRFDPAAHIDEKTIGWWEPLKTVTEFPTVTEALSALPSIPVTLPTAAELPPGYALHGQRIVQSDVNTRTSLVLTYGDGIDEFFVVHTFNAPRPALPAVPAGESDTPYAIVYYQDLSVAQLLFNVNGVETMVIGRAGQYHLPALARDLLRRSVLPD